MYKIAILGCENSHADSFLEFIKNDADFSDIEVIGIYSDDYNAAQSLSKRFNVDILKHYSDASDIADGIMVTARHGNNHLKYAEPYLEKGIPVFMDKPITISPDDAKQMIEAFKKFGNKFTGGSSLKHCEAVKNLKLSHNASKNTDQKTIGGIVRAPLDPKNDYGDFYFYAQHLVEIVCEVFGSYPKSVTAHENDKGITVLFRYDDYDITGFYAFYSYHYFISRFSPNDTESEKIIVDEKAFREELYQFYKLLKTGDIPQDAARFIAPVYIMNAIEASLKNKAEEYIKW